MVFTSSLQSVVFSAEPAATSTASTHQLANRSYRLTASLANDVVKLRLDDLRTGCCIADGPCLYHAVAKDGETSHTADRLGTPSITVDGQTLVIRGALLGLDLEHRFTAPKDRELLEERVVVRNRSDKRIALTDFEVGMQQRIADKNGRVLPEFAADRLVAVPFRHRATDPKGREHDYLFQEVVTQPGYEPRMDNMLRYTELPSRHRVSEGWAWTHGKHVLGIFKFCQEHMQFSAVSIHRGADGAALRFGGAAITSDEPADLGRMAPGATVDLGVVRYETLEGGFMEAAYAFRAMLDEMGCRFPKEFNPPVHWEQLYDMPDAWNDRPHRYTKAIVEREAAKGKAYSCESLYLDPGWDTHLGSFLWGEAWLGPRKQFIDEMQSKYGLKVSLHCPLATWMSHGHFSNGWGPNAVETYPASAKRLPPELGNDAVLVSRNRTATKKPCLAVRRRKPVPHQPTKMAAIRSIRLPHLNDGWYGNSASWIANKMPAWAEVDLGAAYSINEVRLGNDHTGMFKDRAATELRILTATTYAADSECEVVARGGSIFGRGDSGDPELHVSGGIGSLGSRGNHAGQ